MTLTLMQRLETCDWCHAAAAVRWEGGQYCGEHALELVGVKPALMEAFFGSIHIPK